MFLNRIMLSAAIMLGLGSQFRTAPGRPLHTYPRFGKKFRKAKSGGKSASVDVRQPSGQSFRSLNRAFNSGWRPDDRNLPSAKRLKLYMNSHARMMTAWRIS